MRIGAIVLATEQGLGYLAKDFYENGIIQKVYIHPHSSRTNHREWYPRESIVDTTDQLIEECDVIIAFETFFDWKVIPKAREKGKKTVLIPMYECTPFPNPYQADLILNPSALDQKYYPQGTEVTIPVTANFRLREKAQVFIHNAGNGGLGGRNGTKEVLEAMQFVKSPIDLIVRTQNTALLSGLPSSLKQSIEEDGRIEIRHGTFDDIWSEGDVLIFPEKFNGLSLPLQEAFASGMLIMAGDRFPINTWLPKEPLIPVSSSHKEKLAVEFDMAEFSPEVIAEKIDEWFNKDIKSYSLLGGEWGTKNNWKHQRGIYEGLLSRLLEGQAS